MYRLNIQNQQQHNTSATTTVQHQQITQQSSHHSLGGVINQLSGINSGLLVNSVGESVSGNTTSDIMLTTVKIEPINNENSHKNSGSAGKSVSVIPSSSSLTQSSLIMSNSNTTGGGAVTTNGHIIYGSSNSSNNKQNKIDG